MPKFTVGLDIAKSVFQVHVIDRSGQAVIQRKLRRNGVLKFFAGLEPSVVGIEACHSSHYWGRELIKLGHTVRLLPTQYVKPFVVGGKNDANDAAAICMAVSRRDIHTVPVKSAEQQSLQSLHRMREKAIQERTAKSNQIRSMFSEEGHIFPAGLPSLRKGIINLMDNGEAGLTPILKRLGQMYLEQMAVLKAWLDELDAMIDDNFKNNEICQRLATIPGIGPVIATAMVGLVGDPAQFKNGRRFAAWLGLTPRQHSSGGKTRLSGITKRGDGYMRKLLVQGARAVIYNVHRKTDARAEWIKALLARRPANIVAIALANKIARIAWAVFMRGEKFISATS
ncbi:TPA: IS110 family transposase [Salmonella enterica]|nr:IS110 family transposase [Salmonella enterica subsp. enterica serovar Oranienburg]EIG7159377.1 IS110 family transposase [Salmonella enterica]EIS5857199.1 IS110 family transposase [Salmonella enterica]EJS2721488.1 IS110 family transposase [Salmonella enterica]EKC8613793.1 IS110 family transposase [Salmonella enterica]